MRVGSLLICLLFVTGCDEKSPTGPTVRLNQRFTLAPGQSAVVQATTLRVQFVAVIGDSRCPADVVCIQGGDAIVHIRVFDGGETPVSYELHTADSSRASAVHRQARISLVDLQPYPFSTRPVDPSEYRASLTVTSP